MKLDDPYKKILNNWEKRGVLSPADVADYIYLKNAEGWTNEDIFNDFRKKLTERKSEPDKEREALVNLIGAMQQPQANALNMNPDFQGNQPIFQKAQQNLPVNLSGMQPPQANPVMSQLQLGRNMAGTQAPQPPPQQMPNIGMPFNPNMQFRSQNMLSPQQRNLQQAIQQGGGLDDIKKLGELAPGVLPQKKPNFIDEMIKKSNARKAQEEAKQAGIKTSKAQRELDIATGKIKEKLTPEQEWKNTQYKYMLRAFPGLNEATKNSIAFKGIPNPTVEQQKQSKEAEKQLRLEQNKADKEYKSQVSNIYKTAVNIASRDKDKKVNEDQLTDEHLAKAISVLSQDPFRGRDYQKFLDIVQEETTMVDDFLWFDKKVPASLIREKIEYLNPRIIMKQIEETQSLPIQRKPLTGIFK